MIPLRGELEVAKDKISELGESKASKNTLIVELHPQVQHQCNISNMLASSLSLETWKAEIYKDTAESAHDYAGAKFDEEMTNVKRGADRMVWEAQQEPNLIVWEVEQKANRMICEAQQETEVAQSEVEKAREGVEYAVQEAESTEQAARA